MSRHKERKQRFLKAKMLRRKKYKWGGPIRYKGFVPLGGFPNTTRPFSSSGIGTKGYRSRDMAGKGGGTEGIHLNTYRQSSGTVQKTHSLRKDGGERLEQEINLAKSMEIY